MSMPEDLRARVASAYNHAADSYNAAGNTFWDLYGRRTVERLRIPRDARVLDLCCGAGASAIPAASAAGPNGQVVAIDLAERLIRLAKGKAKKLRVTNIDFRVGDFLDLDEAPSSYDYVVCAFGIFFVPDMSAAVRKMWSCVRSGGRLAITTWGSGVFEPVNSMFWAAIRRARPELHKSFNPWDLLGEPELVRRLFAEAGLPAGEIVVEPGEHALPRDEDIVALLMGSGYRGVVEQLPPEDRVRLLDEVVASARDAGVTAVRTDVIYATCVR